MGRFGLKLGLAAICGICLSYNVWYVYKIFNQPKAMNDYSSRLYSEKSVLVTDCYDLTPLTYSDCEIRPKSIRLS